MVEKGVCIFRPISPWIKLVCRILIIIPFCGKSHCNVNHKHESYYRNVSRLYDNLFDSSTSSPYMKGVRPCGVTCNASLEVNISFSLVAVAEIDDVTQEFVTNGFMFLVWKDERLAWNRSDLDDVMLTPDIGQVWRPHMVLINSLRSRNQFEDVNSMIITMYDGSMVWMGEGRFATYCKIDLSKYPFDVQRCSQVFCATQYTQSLVRFVTVVDEHKDLFYFSNHGWDLVSKEVEFRNLNVVSQESFMCPTFTYTLKRRPVIILLNVILPVILLSLLNNFVFIIPNESGEKISYAITVLLSIGVFMQVVSSMTPNASDVVPALVIYLIILLTSSVFTAIMTIASVFMYHQHENMVEYSEQKSNIQAFINVRRHFTSAQTVPTENTTKDATTGNKEDNNAKAKNEGMLYYKLINNICFVIFNLLWLIATVWYFTYTNS